MINLLEAVPFIIFLSYLRNIDTQVPQNWEAPFIVSGFFALMVITLFLYRKILFTVKRKNHLLILLES